MQARFTYDRKRTKSLTMFAQSPVGTFQASVLLERNGQQHRVQRHFCLVKGQNFFRRNFLLLNMASKKNITPPNHYLTYELQSMEPFSENLFFLQSSLIYRKPSLESGDAISRSNCTNSDSEVGHKLPHTLQSLLNNRTQSRPHSVLNSSTREKVFSVLFFLIVKFQYVFVDEFNIPAQSTNPYEPVGSFKKY